MWRKKNSIDSVLSAYHISDRDDGRDDGDDKGGSKSYPSRTSWGAAYSLAEKFGFLFERKFGIRAYDYWWGYTAAQIGLMVADQPLVVYPKCEAKNADGSKKHTAEEMDKLWDDWQRKKQKEGSLVGKKVNLGEYLKGGL